MKKVSIVLLICLLSFCFSACKSAEQKAYEDAARAVDQLDKEYKKAVDDYNKLDDAIKQYKKANNNYNAFR